LKIAVMNYSGNVGKSTAARYLLAPRMNDAQIIAVESINSDGTENETIRGKQFGDLLDSLILIDDAVIDVGASNVEDFINYMTQYSGSHEEFDYFVIPTVSKQKQQRDTVSTILALANIGISSNKIRVLFNMVEPGESTEHIFSGLFNYCDATNSFVVNPKATIHVNDFFGKVKGSDQSLTNILNDQTDFKKLLIQTEDIEEKLRIGRSISLKRLAKGVNEELDLVFEALFKG